MSVSDSTGRWLRPRMRRAGRRRLRLDPVACDGIGVCANLLPSLIRLDRWGFPILADRDLSRREESAARGAVRGCPRAALWIDDPGSARTAR